MNAVKFTFDTHFDGGSGASRAEAARKSRRSYSADEIELIRRAAYGEGEASGQNAAQQATAAAIAQLSAAVGQAIEIMDGEIAVIRTEAVKLAFAASRKLAGAALNAAPVEEIAEVLRLALHEAIAEPRIVVKTPPALADEIKTRAHEIAAEHGYEGRIVFAPDATLSGGDCRIEWKGGGIEKSVAAIETQLTALIKKHFPKIDGIEE